MNFNLNLEQFKTLVRALVDNGTEEGEALIRDLFAQAVITGFELPHDWVGGMCKFVDRLSRADTSDTHLMRVWGPMIGTFADYIRCGQVAMKDGRVATPQGWNYENCPPGSSIAPGSHVVQAPGPNEDYL